MAKIQMYQYCYGIANYPFIIAGSDALIFLITIPLFLFYFYRERRVAFGQRDLFIGDYRFFIPSISKAWRNPECVTSIVIWLTSTLTIYNPCLSEVGFKIAFNLVLLYFTLVFAINSEEDPESSPEAQECSRKIACAHGILAMILFTGLVAIGALVVVYYLGWTAWPIILLVALCGFYIAVIGGSIAQSIEKREEEQKAKKKLKWDWHSWISICEIGMAVTFIIMWMSITDAELI